VGTANIKIYYKNYKDIILPFEKIEFIPNYDVWYDVECESESSVTLTIKNNDSIVHTETGTKINYTYHE
jgi:hypothetical protein